MKRLFIICLFLLISSFVHAQIFNPDRPDATVELKCLDCDVVSSIGCPGCVRGERQTVSGIYIKFKSGSAKIIYAPVTVHEKSGQFWLSGSRGNVSNRFTYSQAGYSNINNFREDLKECQCTNDGGAQPDGAITNIELSGSDLIFTGTLSAFDGTITLPAGAIDYVSNVTYSGGNLNFTGVGSAFSSSVAIPDANDIDYVTGGTLAGSTVTLTGVGNAGGTIDLSGLPDANDIDYVSNVVRTGNNLDFTGVGNAFSSSVVITSYLQAGTNVSILGDGSLGDPYVISSAAGGGGGDGVIPTVTLTNDTSLNFAGINGGFNGTINLSALLNKDETYTINNISDTTALQPNQGDILLIESIDSCEQGLSFYTGNSWTTPLGIIKGENRNQLLYADKNGDNSAGDVGDAHCAFADFIYPARNNYSAGNTIIVQPGTYTYGVDIPASSERQDYQLIVDGQELNYYFEPGTKIIADNSANNLRDPWGFGYGAQAVEGVKLMVDGAGEFDFTNLTSITRAIPTFGQTSEVYFKGKSLKTSGRTFNVATSAAKSSFKFDYMESDELFYLSLAPLAYTPYKWNRSFELTSALLNESLATGAFKHQIGRAFLPGTVDRIKVGSIEINGTGINGTTYLADYGDVRGDAGVGGSFFFEIDHIRNNRTNSLQYADYETASNNTVSAELHYTGGGVEICKATNWYAGAKTIYSPSAAVQVNGFYLDSISTCYIDAGHSTTTGCVSVGLFDPHISRNSILTITGKFINTTTDQPVGMFTAPNIDTSSWVVFRDCDFYSMAANKAVIQISSITASERIIFENCRFWTSDLTQPPVATNSGTPMDVNFVNCSTNSPVRDPNIVERVMAIHTETGDASVINTGFRQKVTIDGSEKIQTFAEDGGNVWFTTQQIADLAPAGAIDYVSNVTYSGGNLNFTGVGSAFSSSVAIPDANDIDYVTGGTLAGTTITLTGVGNAGGTIDLSGLPDANDIDYVSNITLIGNNLNFTGVGNAFNSTINLAQFNDYISNVSRIDDTLRFVGQNGAFNGDVLLPSSGSGDNWATADLAYTNNRTHNANDYTTTVNNGESFIWQNNSSDRTNTNDYLIMTDVVLQLGQNSNANNSTRRLNISSSVLALESVNGEAGGLESNGTVELRNTSVGIFVGRDASTANDVGFYASNVSDVDLVQIKTAGVNSSSIASGYVLTAIDTDGNAEWQPATGGSIAANQGMYLSSGVLDTVQLGGPSFALRSFFDGDRYIETVDGDSYLRWHNEVSDKKFRLDVVLTTPSYFENGAHALGFVNTTTGDTSFIGSSNTSLLLASENSVILSQFTGNNAEARFAAQPNDNRSYVPLTFTAGDWSSFNMPLNTGGFEFSNGNQSGTLAEVIYWKSDNENLLPINVVADGEQLTLSTVAWSVGNTIEGIVNTSYTGGARLVGIEVCAEIVGDGDCQIGIQVNGTNISFYNQTLTAGQRCTVIYPGTTTILNTGDRVTARVISLSGTTPPQGIHLTTYKKFD